MPKQIPVPSGANKPFWDALNEHRLILQNCTNCDRLQYPVTQRCDQCGGDSFEWKEVTGRGHILEYFVIRDSRIRRLQGDQPLNLALITLDEDPGINFLSNLPGTPAGEVPVGAPVELIFEPIVPVENLDPACNPNQLIHEWRVIAG